MKGTQSTAYEAGTCKVRITTQRRWWQVRRWVVGVELWIPAGGHAYAYYVWKPTR